jgi:hypothetical protein
MKFLSVFLAFLLLCGGATAGTFLTCEKINVSSYIESGVVKGGWTSTLDDSLTVKLTVTPSGTFDIVSTRGGKSFYSRTQAGCAVSMMSSAEPIDMPFLVTCPDPKSVETFVFTFAKGRTK